MGSLLLYSLVISFTFVGAKGKERINNNQIIVGGFHGPTFSECTFTGYEPADNASVVEDIPTEIATKSLKAFKEGVKQAGKDLNWVSKAASLEALAQPFAKSAPVLSTVLAVFSLGLTDNGSQNNLTGQDVAYMAKIGLEKLTVAINKRIHQLKDYVRDDVTAKEEQLSGWFETVFSKWVQCVKMFTNKEANECQRQVFEDIISMSKQFTWKGKELKEKDLSNKKADLGGLASKEVTRTLEAFLPIMREYGNLVGLAGQTLVESINRIKEENVKSAYYHCLYKHYLKDEIQNLIEYAKIASRQIKDNYEYYDADNLELQGEHMKCVLEKDGNFIPQYTTWLNPSQPEKPGIMKSPRVHHKYDVTCTAEIDPDKTQNCFIKFFGLSINEIEGKYWAKKAVHYAQEKLRHKWQAYVKDSLAVVNEYWKINLDDYVAVWENIIESITNDKTLPKDCQTLRPSYNPSKKKCCRRKKNERNN